MTRRTVRLPAEPQPPAPRFDADSGMRHTYTDRLVSYCRKLMEDLCEALLAVHDEAQLAAEDEPRPIVRDLSAAAKDLRYLEGWLMNVGDMDHEGRWENRLADLAERLAGRVGEIAGEIEAALAAAPAE